jgi:hypothetical protein
MVVVTVLTPAPVLVPDAVATAATVERPVAAAVLVPLADATD